MLERAALDAGAKTTTLLVEGWRGLSHSYALVNQYQILELLKQPNFALRFTDLPLFNPAWVRSAEAAGFAAADQLRIDALLEAGDSAIDCVYRIASPTPAIAPDDTRRTLTFMVSEMGLAQSNLAATPSQYGAYTRDANAIVTPSRWSRERLVEFGFPEENVLVVPHGVDTGVFAPLSAAERAENRAALGIAPDETLLVNVGGAFWNKGVDVLLLAFARLRASGRKVRLIVKDLRDLYGVTIEQRLRELAEANPGFDMGQIAAAVSVISAPLSRAQLRSLYGIADAYVSPYRAEGFNLPVLEAIACGTPVIVTEGGATDDFCAAGLGWKIPGTLATLTGEAWPQPNRYIEPNAEVLTEVLDALVQGARPDAAGFAAARAQVLAAFTWVAAGERLAALVREEEPPAFLSPAAPVGQADILRVLGQMRPWVAEKTRNIRVGNDYDGGYVLPETVWAADAVLSIGVGHDVSFDLELAARGARVLQFDHTVEASPQAHENFVFAKLGLGVRSEGEFLSLADMNARLDALGATRPLLKFDIEGGEYEIFGALDPEALRRFEIITCEIHDLERLVEPGFFAQLRRFMAVMTTHHLPVHLHPNNYGPLVLVPGIPVPTVLELTFLRRDTDSFTVPATLAIPGPLDRPNHPGLPDIVLGAFCLPA